jgi:hypothetical protein
VHRKRSQVAVVAEDGQVQLNKNVVNGSEPMLRLIGDLPPGTPVAFEAVRALIWRPCRWPKHATPGPFRERYRDPDAASAGHRLKAQVKAIQATAAVRLSSPYRR